MPETTSLRAAQPALMEHVTYGKVVCRAGQGAPYWSPYGITKRSAGLSDIPLDSLTPHSIIDEAQISPDVIAASMRTLGGCFGRNIEFVSRSGLVRPMFAMMRFRFRPEAGEASIGRVYLQARCVLPDQMCWWAHGSDLLKEFVPHLRADPDVVTSRADMRLTDSPVSFCAMGSMGANVPTSVLRASHRIMHFLQSDNEESILELGDESITSEGEFLHALSLVMVWIREGHGIVTSFGFSSGCSFRGPGRWIRYVPGRTCAFRQQSPTDAYLLAEFLDWRRTLMDAALSSQGYYADRLFDKTKRVWSLLSSVCLDDREQIEQILPERERALFHHFAVAAGWDSSNSLTPEMHAYSTDADFLIEKFSQCSLQSFRSGTQIS